MMNVAAANSWNRFYYFLIVIGLAASMPANSHSQENNIQQQAPIKAKLNTARNVSQTWSDSSNNRFTLSFDREGLNQENNQFTFMVDENVVSDFWIGIQCEQSESTSFSPEAMPDTTLSVNGGMKILSVNEWGAAEAAGIVKGDVLLKFSGKSMNSLNDLYKVIGETEDNEAEILVVRKGKLKSLSISPQRRPSEKPEAEATNLPKVNLATIENAYRNELASVQIPEGYELSVKLVRGKKIDLKVKKQNLVWNIDESSIEKLPEDVKPVASNLYATCKSMVASPNHNVVLQVLPTLQRKWMLNNRLPQLQWSESALRKAATGVASEIKLSRRLDDIRAQLRELTKVVQQMKSEQLNKE